ncbi:hypothetical protein [Flavobacterium sp.]|uniref:hypothetical protein n=1 Tax=Flavobacterium sp. TaxID=239 RepID=UPI0037539133
MKNQFSIFKKYSSIEQTQEIITFLNSNNIETEIGNNIPPVDSLLTGNNITPEFEIKIKITDFETATKLLENIAEDQINQVNKDHYLFSFSNEELYDIILKQDEWNEFDYSLAKKLLSERGKPIDEALIKSLKKQRLNDLSKPEENQKPWIITGYIFAIMGGFFGIIIGYVLMTSKKNLPNGQRIYSYHANDRQHGKMIFYIGIVLLPFYIILRILLAT